MTRPGPRFTVAPTRRAAARRGMLLLVSLVIITVLGLLAGTFAFRMGADLASVNAMNDLQQARWAARSGLDRVIHLLRTSRTDVDTWYNNPEPFRRVPVWMPGESQDRGGSELLADKEVVPNKPAWRYSVVAYQLDGDEAQIRYGVTDEASKVNLNVAPRAQLLALFDQLKLENTSPEQLADALLDWRDNNNAPISINGAESSYYFTMEPPYRAKNRDLQTVEELLMIKGFTGRVLYGEDYNRNGYLDDNEKDGEDGVFPPDNGDEVLERGLLPLITVSSWDLNFTNDNKPRIPLNAIRSKEFLAEPDFEYILTALPEAEAIVDFIVAANTVAGYHFRSVGELLGLELYEGGKSNYTQAWKQYDQLVTDLNQARLDQQEEGEGQGQNQDQEQGTGQGETNQQEMESSGAQDESAQENGQDANGAEPDAGSNRDDGDQDHDDQKASRRRQSLRDNEDQEGASGGPENEGDQRGGRGRDRQRDRQRPGRPERPGRPPISTDRPSDGRQPARPEGAGAGTQPAGEGEEEPLTPLNIPNPITAEHMRGLTDLFTAKESPLEPLVGQINANTASPRVLKTIPGLTEDDVASIVGMRESLSGEQKQTLGWLVASGALSPQTFAIVCNALTTRSIQYHVEVIGFADHVGAFKRIEAIVEMRGQLAQIRYYRDISSLGAGYPVRDDERSEGFAFIDQ